MVGIPLPTNLSLLTADASDLVLGALLQPTWGVYFGGSPVILPAAFAGLIGAAAQPTIASIASIISGVASVASLFGISVIVPSVASTVEFEYGQDFPLSNYPQELGGFQSYNRVTLPFDVKLKLASSGPVAQRQAFLQTCLSIANAPAPATFSVVTPELTFTSVSCTHIDWHRTATRGNTLIQVDLYFSQVPIVSAVSFQNTAQPGEAGQQALGNVQPTSLSMPITQAFSALSIL